MAEGTNSERSNAPDARRSSGAFFNWMMAIFTAPFAAASIYGFVGYWIEFGVGPVATKFYEFYATVVVPLFSFIPSWLVGLIGWQLPNWYSTILPLSFVIMGAVTRANLMVDSRYFYRLGGGPVGAMILYTFVALTALPALLAIATTIFMAFFIAASSVSIPLSLPYWGVRKLFRLESDHAPKVAKLLDENDYIWRLFLLNMALALLALLVAFAENWFPGGTR